MTKELRLKKKRKIEDKKMKGWAYLVDPRDPLHSTMPSSPPASALALP